MNLDVNPMLKTGEAAKDIRFNIDYYYPIYISLKSINPYFSLMKFYRSLYH